MTHLNLPSTLPKKREKLLETLRQYGRVAVAFSAGVDSTVVAKAAQLACGKNAIAVTAQSSSLATGELELAERIAEEIGIRHVAIATYEFENPQYRRNEPDRCFHCKTELYSLTEEMMQRLQVDTIVNGANVDDLGDFRPGMTAAKKYRVRSPLIEVDFSKAEVRELAQHWKLPNWDKPASPCLSSRIAYGLEVTEERVRRVDQAERFLREEYGLRELRVRLEQNGLARIEVPLDRIESISNPVNRAKITNRFRDFGFRNITIDEKGFRSGSMNEAISVEEIERLA